MTNIKTERKILQQEKIELDISNNNTKSKELSLAQSLISLITNLYNKIIYDYDRLIYNTGACIFKYPNIIHCTKCLFFKISAEFMGDLNSAEFSFKEDPPYFTINKKLNQETQNILNELFEFMINLKDYRMIIKQLDKETPRLMYIIHENNNNVSKENINKINKSLSLFHDLSKLRNTILVQYKNQIYDLIMSNSNYCAPINKLGKLAASKKITDKYEIAFLFNQFKNDADFKKHFSREDWSLYRNINDAKQTMEKKLKSEKQDEDHYNLSENKYNVSLTQITSLSSSYKMYLPFTKENE